MAIHDWTRVTAGIFHHFHHEWISTILRALNAGLLPPGYYALAEQIAGGLGPDVLALEDVRGRSPGTSGNGSGVAPQPNSSDSMGVATLPPPRVRFTASVEVEPYARKRNRIVIRHSSDDDVIAMIEIMSPGNKSSRHALASFVAKTLELLDAGIHLLLLDLLPPTTRDPQGIHGAILSELCDVCDFVLPADQRLTLVAYSVGDVKQAFIEPVAVGGILPEMPLFLTPPRYVPVPLESTYNAAFEAVPKRWRDELAD